MSISEMSPFQILSRARDRRLISTAEFMRYSGQLDGVFAPFIIGRIKGLLLKGGAR